MGQGAEQAAARYLRHQGYRILAQNVRVRGGELDIVAEEGETLCFVEVRSRHSAEFGHPLESVDRRKQTRVVRAARRYCAQQKVGDREIRFDVVAIVWHPQQEITLLRGAFVDREVW